MINLGKYLNDSAETGTKISKNIHLFSYSFKEKEPFSDGSSLYRFTWNYDGQTGYVNIVVKDGKISNSSLINTAPNSSHRFGRPLGLYNDRSLEPIFQQMLTSINVDTNGVYTE